MNIPSINSLRQYPIVRKLLPKKHIELPMELSDNAYKKLLEHRKAFDYLANRYGIKYDFSPAGQDSAYVYCCKNSKSDFAWSKTEVNPSDTFDESAKKIYKLTDEVLNIFKDR